MNNGLPTFDELQLIQQYILEFEEIIDNLVSNKLTDTNIKDKIIELKDYWKLQIWEKLSDLEKKEFYYLNHNILKEIILFKNIEITSWNFTKEEKEFFEKINTFLMDNPIRLNDEENIIHFIWIGVIPDSVSQYLKIWSDIHKDWKINFYYEPEGYLIKTLEKLINVQSGWDTNELITKKEAEKIFSLENVFFEDYDHKKSIDQNIKEFILKNNLMTEDKINEIIQIGNNLHENTFKDLPNIKQVPINEENFGGDDNKIIIYKNSKELWKMYLQELTLRHNFACASDILRYNVLYNYGGCYFDCDVLPRINPEIIPYIEEEIKKLISKDVETSLFVEKLISQNITKSLDKEYNRNLFENIKEVMFKLLLISQKDDYSFIKDNFLSLRIIFSKILTDSFIYPDKNHNYKLTDNYSNFKCFIDIIKNAFKKIKQDNVNQFLSLPKNISFDGFNQVIFDYQLLDYGGQVSLVSDKTPYSLFKNLDNLANISGNNNVIIALSKSKQLAEIINLISSRSDEIKKNFLNIDIVGESINSSLNPYRFERKIDNCFLTLEFTGPKMFHYMLSKCFKYSIFVYTLLPKTEYSLTAAVKLTMPITSETINPFKLNSKDLWFIDTFESFFSALAFKDDQNPKELAQSFNKELVEENSNPSSISEPPKKGFKKVHL